MNRDANKSWGVFLEEDGWYFYGCVGNPNGPHDTEEKATDALDRYVEEYDRDDLFD